MEEMCFEPCPQDCEMSSWSAWTKCHVEHCGIGYQNRSRYVIEPELDGGRQCPDLYEGEVSYFLYNVVKHVNKDAAIGDFLWVSPFAVWLVPKRKLNGHDSLSVSYQHTSFTSTVLIFMK